MYVRSHARRVARALFVAVFAAASDAALAAQLPEAGHQHDPAVQPPADAAPAEPHQHDMAAMSQPSGQAPATREGSGTSWLPDESPMYALHRQAGGWMLMGHGSAFLQYLHETGVRGSEQ